MMKISENKLVTKTKLVMFAAITVGLVMTITLAVNQQNSITQEIEMLHEGNVEQGGEPINVPAPVNLPRSGIPFLVAYPLAIEPANYHQVNANDYSWITKTISRGEANISEQEVREYFTVTEDKNFRFGVILQDDTKKYYSIEYREVPISLQDHNIKAYRLEVTPDKYVTVNLKSHSWLKNVVDNEFTWSPIDTPSAIALKQLTNNELFNFRVIYEDGHSEFYNIRYAGPGLNTINQQ